jgi:hypothetical protein
MTIVVSCCCGRQFAAQPHLLGEQLPCPFCGQPIPIARRQIPTASNHAIGATSDSTLGDNGLNDRTALAPAGPVSAIVLPSPEPYKRPRKKIRINPRPFILTGVTVLIVLILAGAGLAVYECVQRLSTVSWTTYVSEEGGFSVRLPDNAFAYEVKQRRETKLNIGAYRPYTFEGIVFADKTRVGVFYFDFPSPPSDPANLPKYMRFLEPQYHGETILKSQQEISLGGYVGRETVYEQRNEGRSVPIYSRWYLVGSRVYEVAWMPARDEPSLEDRRLLFDSFQLLGRDSQPD